MASHSPGDLGYHGNFCASPLFKDSKQLWDEKQLVCYHSLPLTASNFSVSSNQWWNMPIFPRFSNLSHCISFGVLWLWRRSLGVSRGKDGFLRKAGSVTWQEIKMNSNSLDFWPGLRELAWTCRKPLIQAWAQRTLVFNPFPKMLQTVWNAHVAYSCSITIKPSGFPFSTVICNILSDHSNPLPGHYPSRHLDIYLTCPVFFSSLIVLTSLSQNQLCVNNKSHL